MRTPWGIRGDWRWRRFEERVRAREAAEWLPETGHEDWGDDRIGTALTTVFNLRESLDARRLSALRPGVELGVAEVKEAWAGMDGGPYAFTGERLPTKPLERQVGRLALAADGSVLAMGNSRGQIGLWDPRTGRRTVQLPDHPYPVDRLGMAPDGSWIAIGDLYGIRVLDLPSGDERFTVKPRGTEFATTEDWLAVPDRERVQIRSTRTGELLNTLELHTENIQECHLSPDRKYLLTMDREGTLIMWDAAAVAP
ncbi:WD40 repeat domain-containing protein [Streptomyces sp. NPDC006465]|uniref:WD40 repeat domain-containing protein n=1 Tax=Streptomyces sp. NPDC006465 TaxID=3157174 RepID=UPI0033B340BF